MRVDVSQGCVGCTACQAGCPKNAITMVENHDGFYVPQIDDSVCVDCGLCVKICPLRSEHPADEPVGSKYVFPKKLEDSRGSASGGFFYLLAKDFVENGGMVCGCIWDDGFVARHICGDTLEEVEKMRGSKYVQSDMNGSFPKIKEKLEAGGKVFFCGTSCQTTALHAYLKKDYENLVTCALICGGVPSPKALRYYLNAIEQKVGSKIVYLNLRGKTKGWLVPTVEIAFENGKKVNEVLLTYNLFGTNFGQGLFINEACMHCDFKLGSVRADLLISDHWGINAQELEASKNTGASAVILMTPKGEAAFSRVEKLFCSADGNLDDIAKSHGVLTKDHKPNPHRQEFFEKVTQENILELLAGYYPDILPRHPAKRAIVKFLYKTKLYIPVYTTLWKINSKRSMSKK